MREVLAEPLDDMGYVRDSAIKRFELCADLSWKCVQHCLEERYNFMCASPRTCFLEAFKAEVLPDDPFYLEILTMRNLATHSYNQKLADRIYQQLPDALHHFDSLASSLSIK